MKTKVQVCSVDSDAFCALNFGGVLFIDVVCDFSVSCRCKLRCYICILIICRDSSVGIVTKLQAGCARTGESDYWHEQIFCSGPAFDR